MNEPEFKMFFKGSEEDFVEIFNFSSKVIKEKQPDAVIVMAGAAGMFPESKKFWKSALPKIKDHFELPKESIFPWPSKRRSSAMRPCPAFMPDSLISSAVF